jgi:type IV pilus assembly protein PilV
MTLVEVLVATVVIAIGLLGVAALQINALQGASNANYRSRAVDLTSSLSDRVRANLVALSDYVEALDPPGPGACNSPPPDVCAMAPGGSEGDTTLCTPTQMAEYDVWEINCRLLQEFPPGSTLAINCAGGCPTLAPMEIIISWPTQEMSDVAGTTPINEEIRTTIIPGAPRAIPGE